MKIHFGKHVVFVTISIIRCAAAKSLSSQNSNLKFRYAIRSYKGMSEMNLEEVKSVSRADG